MKSVTRKHHYFYIIFIFFISLLPFFSRFTFCVDTLTAAQFLTGNQTLISSGQVFELGFFSPGNSNAWYVGIWYKNIPRRTYVWVANRDQPLANFSPATFMIANQSIVLLDQWKNIVWSSNRTNASNPVMQLLDTGNLVLREASDQENGQFLWQSFDHPTDTLLPGMKLGWDLNPGLDRYISSWKSPEEDPSTGAFSFRLHNPGNPEIFYQRLQRRIYRSGPWNGIRFSGTEMRPQDNISFDFIIEPDEEYFSFHILSNSTYSRLTVSPPGHVRRYTWSPDTHKWVTVWFAPKDECDVYSACGPWGICDTTASPICQCLRGFQPKNPEAWNLNNRLDGCVRKTDLDCPNDKFLHLKDVKLPETTTSYVNKNMGLKDCKILCLRNCSCTAYANSNIANGGSGCVIWVGDLLDMRVYPDGGQDLYVRLAASNFGNGGNNALVFGLSFGIGIPLLALIGCCIWKRKWLLSACKRNTEQKVSLNAKPGPLETSHDLMLSKVSSKKDYSGEKSAEELELPIYDFYTIATATDNFSFESKLGQGGFGGVYKGWLAEGQEIAVKRLSKNSCQGIEEFKNEVKLIARLQHRNLVRLIGCCTELDEKMLIYEYMENRSLDSVLFNKSKCSLLNWQRRFSIICGIARGLLYLHQDSRYRIIHRDLKASNILLDGDWTPKISDFGMARIFGGDQTEINTKRVVGTYGYMSPEYAMDGLFSVKSDVFSFGVLVLEIVSGKKNGGFYHSNSELNLVGHAWKVWEAGKALEMLDVSVTNSFSAGEVLRCIQVGLLCVQERAEDRPTMSCVLLMLSSDTAAMPQPKAPGFLLGRSPCETDSSSGIREESFTINRVTVTSLDAR